MTESGYGGWHEYSQARRVRGPDALEYAAVAVTILVVLTGAAAFLVHPMHIVQATEGYMAAASVKPDMIVHRAVHGSWPAPDDPVMADMASHFQGVYVRHVSLAPDHALVVDVSFSNRLQIGGPRELDASHAGGTLSFRPALLGVPGAYSVMWLCGHAMPPSGPGKVFGQDRTTLAVNDLPFGCRRPRP
ncbi:MAG TPA: hypothetical protein VFP92_04980 [Rhodanobacteraceae bacterium]|nr:hypothetical protein [Rhodanobacteraceae bacterium]